LSGAIDNWPLTGDDIFNQSFDLASTPDDHTVPAGYQLQIILKVTLTAAEVRPGLAPGDGGGQGGAVKR
jgi:hypothetical protein